MVLTLSKSVHGTYSRSASQNLCKRKLCTVMAANKIKTSSLSAQDRSGSELMQGGRREGVLIFCKPATRLYIPRRNSPSDDGAQCEHMRMGHHLPHSEGCWALGKPAAGASHVPMLTRRSSLSEHSPVCKRLSALCQPKRLQTWLTRRRLLRFRPRCVHVFATAVLVAWPTVSRFNSSLETQQFCVLTEAAIT